MKIQLVREWTRTEADGSTRVYKAGETASVLHALGRMLVMDLRFALWIESEPGDPEWHPPLESFCAKKIAPTHNRQMTAQVNR